MALRESYREPDENWPPVGELEDRSSQRVVILPDRIEQTTGKLTAAYRPDAQALRVDAKQRGIEVELYKPAEARRGVYEEHAADWVLPVLMSVPVNLACGLIVNLIQARLDAWRAAGSPQPPPEMRCGLLEIDKGELRVRDLEGPAVEVRDALVKLAETAKDL
jgi:hypothetical protein